MTVYVPQAWANGAAGNTPLSSTRLAHIESGLVAVDQRIDGLGGGGGGGGTAKVYDATTQTYQSQAWSPYVGPVDPTTLGATVTDATPWLDTDPSVFGLGLAAMPVTGYWVSTPHTLRSTLSTPTGRTHFLPLWVTQRFTVAALAVEATAATASASMQVGIYNTAGTLPGNLVYDGGVLDISASGVHATTTFSVVLDAGLWWLASLALTAATPTRCVATGGFVTPLAQASAGGATISGMWRLDSQTVLPATAPTTSSLLGGSGPLVWAQCA